MILGFVAVFFNKFQQPTTRPWGRLISHYSDQMRFGQKFTRLIYLIKLGVVTCSRFMVNIMNEEQFVGFLLVVYLIGVCALKGF